MATFRKRGNSWRVEICIDGDRESATFDTKALAKEWADRRSTELRQYNGQVGSLSSRTLLADLLKEARRTKPALSRTRRTGEVEKYRIDRLLKHSFCQKEVSKLTEYDFIEYRQDRENAGVSCSTIRRELGIVRTIFNQLIKRRQLAYNPVSPVLRSLPRDREIASILSGEDFRVFEYAHEELNNKSTRNPWLFWALKLAGETGLRKAELLGLRWSAIDFAKHVATIKQVDDLPDKKGNRTTEGTKNGDPEREIPLSPEAIGLLRSIPRANDPELSDHVIPITYNALGCAYKRLKRRAKLAYRWHDLRHTAATNFLERLKNVAHVALITGHKDWRSLKRYTHPKASSVAKLLEQNPASKE